MKLSDSPVQSGSGAATKEDIKTLGDKLVWPPEFTRDPNLKKMQTLLKLEEEVVNNDSLTDTEKVLRVAEYKRQYNLHDNERFEPLKLGAIPPAPLIELKKEEESSDDISDVDEQTVLYEGDLLKPIQQHRRQKAYLMLKKLAAEGSLRWDADGTVYYKGKLVEGANMGKLVHYFQTAHKRNPLNPPEGQVIFGKALRSANAMEDVQLGGEDDDVVRQVFRGNTPARFNPYGERTKPRQRKMKSSINKGSHTSDTTLSPLAPTHKVVTQLEFK